MNSIIWFEKYFQIPSFQAQKFVTPFCYSPLSNIISFSLVNIPQPSSSLLRINKISENFSWKEVVRNRFFFFLFSQFSLLNVAVVKGNSTNLVTRYVYVTTDCNKLLINQTINFTRYRNLSFRFKQNSIDTPASRTFISKIRFSVSFRYTITRVMFLSIFNSSILAFQKSKLQRTFIFCN